MGKNDLRSQSLDLLRFPLAVVVLAIHTFSTSGLIVRGERFVFDDYQFFIEVNHWIDAFLRGQSVPIYYFISGFVFFVGVEMTRETYLRKFKNRVKTLVIPYFIWNIISLLSVFVITFNPLFSYFTAKEGVSFNFSLESFLSCFWNYDNGLFIHEFSGQDSTFDSNVYPINGPLWFVRDLIVVVLSTPLLYWLIKHLKHYFVVLLGFVWFFVPYFEVKTMGFEMAYFFFSWGAYMSINKKDMIEFFCKYTKLSAILFVALCLLHIYAAHYYPEARDTIKQLNVLVGLFFAYSFATLLLRKGVCKVSPFLASASFFIYVSHFMVVERMTKLMFILISPNSNFGILAVYILSVFLSVCLLLAVFWVLKTYAPTLLKVLAGRK